MGFVGALGALIAWWLWGLVLAVSQELMLVVIAMFLACGLNPAVTWLIRRGMRRAFAVLTVVVGVLAVLTGFVLTVVPVMTDQATQIYENAPGYLDTIQSNAWVQRIDDKFDVIAKARDYVENGGFGERVFGGVLGIGARLLSSLLNGFIILVLMLYFLSSLELTKASLYRLAPASRRERVTRLGDRIIDGIGGYVSGAFVVASVAGVSTFVFLWAIGLGKYAVALAFVVMVLDVIPMIGATLGAVVVTLIAFANDPTMGLYCAIFFLAYQQFENYVVYPKVMSSSVDIPGSLTVIAALVGAGLLGVTGALLAIPTAAALLMLTKEVFIRRQDQR